MKSLNEIIQEIDDRRLPEDIAQVGEWIKQMDSLGVSASSRISMLVAHSRRTFFKEENGFHKWASESFGFRANHTSHCAKIGDVLLDARPDSFRKLAALPFNKLLPVSRLPAQKLEELIASKDVAAMTREQLRDAVREELGEEKPEPKKQNPNETRLKAIESLASLQMEELDSLVKSADAEAAQAMLKAGRNLLAIGLEAAQNLNLEGALDAAERLLSLQLNSIRKRKDAIAAAKVAPQLESKTA